MKQNESDKQVCKRAQHLIKGCTGEVTTTWLMKELQIDYAQSCRVFNWLEEKGLIVPTRYVVAHPNSNNDQPIEELYPQAERIARESTRVSAAVLQRHLKIGYAKAAQLMDLLEVNHEL